MNVEDKASLRAYPKRKPIALAAAAMAGVLAGPAIAAPGAAVGPAFAALSATVASQQSSSVARDAAGDTVVVWADESVHAIFGRRFAADASPLDNGFQISATGTQFGDESLPRVAMDTAGNFVVAWIEHANKHAHVVARRYRADGSAAAPQFPVEAASSRFDDGGPAIAMDAGGDFVIGWERTNAVVSRDLSLGYNQNVIELSERSVVAQRFAADATPRGATITAATRPTVIVSESVFVSIFLAAGTFENFSIGKAVDIAMDASGDFVLAWGGRASAGTYVDVGLPLPTTSSIFARRYSAAGKALELAPTNVNTALGLSPVSRNATESAPVVAMDSSGAFTLAWSVDDVLKPRALYYTSSIHARQYDSAGKARGAVLDIAQTTTTNAPLAIAATANGGFALTWAGDFGVTLVTRLFSGAGIPVAGPTTINPRVDHSFISQPSMASSASGEYIVSWTDGNPFLFGANLYDRVFLQRFAGP